MSTLRVDNLNARTGTTISVPSGTTMYLPGHVVQVVNTYLTTTSVMTMTTGYNVYNDISGLSASITPKSVNSKIYITARWFGEFSPQTSTFNTMFNIKRNGNLIGQPAAFGTAPLGIMMAAISYYVNDAASTPEMVFFDYYDSPASTSSLTYQISANGTDATTLYTNRTVTDTGGPGYERGTSSITLFEIAG